MPRARRGTRSVIGRPDLHLQAPLLGVPAVLGEPRMGEGGGGGAGYQVSLPPIGSRTNFSEPALCQVSQATQGLLEDRASFSAMIDSGSSGSRSRVSLLTTRATAASRAGSIL